MESLDLVKRSVVSRNDSCCVGGAELTKDRACCLEMWAYDLEGYVGSRRNNLDAEGCRRTEADRLYTSRPAEEGGQIRMELQSVQGGTKNSSRDYEV